MKKLDAAALVLVLIGGITWGLIGLFDWDPVQYFFRLQWVERAIFIAVGISGIYQIVNWNFVKHRWK